MANSIEVARASVTIVPTMEGAQQKITSDLTSVAGSPGVASAGKSAGNHFADGIAKGLLAATAVTAAVTAVAAKAAGAFVDAASDVASYGDNIDKMSQKMGISAEAYQEWDFVMQHCGTSMDTLKASMKTMATAAASGSEAFEKLGIAQEDIANMSQEELFGATIAALQEVDNETERTYLAGQLLGRGATELGALLNMSAEETAGMKEQLHELGGVMSDESVAASASFQDALQNMQVAADGVKNNMMSQFLPGMTSAMEGLAQVFSGDSSGMLKVKEGLMSMLDTVQDVLPGFLKMGMDIVETIIEGLVPMLPSLLSTVSDAFGQVLGVLVASLPDLIPVVLGAASTVIDAILDNLPAIIDAAFGILLAIVDKLSDPDSIDKLIDTTVLLIETLAEGLINALPQLIPAVIQIIVRLTTSLIEHIPDLILAAGKLILGLVTGLISAIPEVVKGAGKIVISILDTLGGLPKKLISAAATWGKDMIDSFVQGIKNCIGKVSDAVSGVASTVKSFLGFSEPEEGPLSNFHTYAPDMIELFTDGLAQSKAKISSTLTSVLQLPDATIPKSSGEGGNITIPIYLGNELLDNVIVSANQRINLRSGGLA